MVPDWNFESSSFDPCVVNNTLNDVNRDPGINFSP